MRKAMPRRKKEAGVNRASGSGSGLASGLISRFSATGGTGGGGGSGGRGMGAGEIVGAGEYGGARPQPQRIEPNEARRIGLVVGALIGFHGGDVGIVERQLALASRDDEVALVEFQPHGAGDVFLAFLDRGLEEFPFRRE